jgi:Ca2+-binding RTX toxin-like protein
LATADGAAHKQEDIMAAQRLTEGRDDWSGLFYFDDYILALGGADTLNGGGGNDRLYGGSGADTIRGGEGSDILDGGDDLQLVATDSDNSIDHLFGEAGNDTLRGKAGDDVLDGGIGADNLYGGDGHDTLFSNSNDGPSYLVETLADVAREDGGGVMDGGAGNDTIVTSHDFSGTMTIIGGSGTDTLAFGRDSNFFNGPTTLTNTVDLLTESGTTVFNSTLVVREIENIDGDGYNDVFRGNNEANVLRGFGGNDRLQGRGGADTLDGGAGIDVADYSGSLDVDIDLTRATQIGSHAQGDVLIGIEEVDGSAFGDKIRGNTSANYLFGAGGNDLLEGRGGADTLNGGAGIDTASYESSTSGVTVRLDDVVAGTASSATGGHATGDTLISIENLVGSAHADLLTGSSINNRIEGGGGADEIHGLAGADVLSGGDGNDVIVGGQQNDVIDGGFGNDTLSGGDHVDTVSFESWDPTGIFVQLDEQIRIELGNGNALGSATRTVTNRVTGATSTEIDSLSSFENVTGSNRGETILGNSGVNVLEGRGGNDTLVGRGGNDTLDGGSGVDTADYDLNSARVVVTLRDGADGTAVESGATQSTDTLRNIENVRGSAFNDDIFGNRENNRLSGGRGDDNISGGDGDDVLIGGAQTDIDRLTGGAGRDTFLYQSRDDSRTTLGATGDAIQDFNVNDDLVDLRALNVNSGDLLIQNFSADGTSLFRATEDVNHNGAIDVGEFSILIRTEAGGVVTVADFLL